MEWLKKQVNRTAYNTELLRKQHYIIVPSNHDWLLGNRLLAEILTADGRQVIIEPDNPNKQYYRKMMKLVRQKPAWILTRNNTPLCMDIVGASIHPAIGVIAESLQKEPASEVIRGIHPQRVVLCADSENFETQARLIQKGTSMITVGQGRAKYQIKELITQNNQTSFTIISPFGRQEIIAPTVSGELVCEIAMAIAAAHELGCDTQAITSGINNSW